MNGPAINAAGILADLDVFRGAEERAIERMAAATSALRVARATVLYRRGDSCTGFHVLVSGQVKLAVNSNHGDEKVLKLVAPGSSFGEAPMFLGQSYLMSAETLSDSTLLHVARDAVVAEVRRSAELACRMIACLSSRIYEQFSDLERYTLSPGLERVVTFLLHAQPDATMNGSRYLTLPAKKGVIASRLNLTHEHFSRILHELIAARVIEMHGRSIHIPDTDSLLDYVADKRAAGGSTR
jgi:CRP-like cAMP-binding protein